MNIVGVLLKLYELFIEPIGYINNYIVELTAYAADGRYVNVVPLSTMKFE